MNRLLWTGLLLVAVASLSAPSRAQVNTERLRAVDADGVQATLGGTLALQAGNVDLFEVGGNARVDARRMPHYAFVTGELHYGIKDDAPFRDRTFGHLRYNYHLRSWLVAEAFGQLERDGFARLALRTLAGGGLRVQYLDTETFTIFQGTTPMYEHEALEAQSIDRHPATTSTVRWSNYLNVRFHLSDTAHLKGTVYVQPRVDAVEDIRVLQQTTLGVNLTEHVRFTADFNLRYDSRPPDTVESLDLTLRNGLTVSF